MNNEVLFSKKSDEWATPRALFDGLNAEFRFTLDPCATAKNALCRKFYTQSHDGLLQDWSGERVFMNPPYSNAKEWVAKAAYESTARGATVVALLPARTDVAWFHDYIYKKRGVDIRFLRGRLKFGNSTSGAPFPSMVVIFW